MLSRYYNEHYFNNKIKVILIVGAPSVLFLAIYLSGSTIGLPLMASILLLNGTINFVVELFQDKTIQLFDTSIVNSHNNKPAGLALITLFTMVVSLTVLAIAPTLMLAFPAIAHFFASNQAYLMLLSLAYVHAETLTIHRCKEYIVYIPQTEQAHDTHSNSKHSSHTLQSLGSYSNKRVRNFPPKNKS